jgi:predicted phage terminase large subunit-like protein
MTATTIDRPRIERIGKMIAEHHRRMARKAQSGPGGLMEFIRYYWHVLEPETPLVEGWTMEAICEHLEAVTAGRIKRLLINVSPGSCKSLIVNVFWPAWEAGPMDMAHLRYVTFSYSASLTMRDNGRYRDLIVSREYQELWGKRVRPIKIGEMKISNDHQGWKLASSVGGVGTGERGDRVILDDPHNVKEAESDVVRDETIRWFRESMSNRLNSLETGVIIVIMQRVHEEDISGIILSLGLEYDHLMIPMEYDWYRQTNDDGSPQRTSIGWYDPRWAETPEECDKTLAWPERFPPAVIEGTKHVVGPFAWASQYMQSPEPRGGGIFKREWWLTWAPPDGKFPEFEYIVASLDSAFTENEQNNPSAMTVWGVWLNDQKKRRLMLINAWRKFLPMHGPRVEKQPNELVQVYRQRSLQHWGLVEWCADTCRRFKADRLLIEAKTSGITAGQELARLHGREGWAVQMCPVKGDKVARALAVQPTFSQGMVYANERLDWAEMVIDEMAKFPKGKYDDLTDSATMAIKHLRDIGLAQTDEEAVAEEMDRVRHRPRLRPLYPTA